MPAIHLQYTDATNKTHSDEAGFVRKFKELAATGNTFDISIGDNIGRDKTTVTSKTISLVATGKFPAVEVAAKIAKLCPELHAKIARFQRATPVSAAFTMSNLADAWNDVCSHIWFHNRDKYQSVAEVEETLLKKYRVEFKQDDSETEFNGTFFGKIADRMIPNRTELDTFDHGKALGLLLQKLANGDSAVRNAITTSTGRGAALAKESQLSFIESQAKKHYIAYTPAGGAEKPGVRFSKIGDGQTQPGRNAKIEGATKEAYVAYKQVSGAGRLFDRTVSSNGDAILESTKVEKKKVDPKDGATALTYKAPERKPLNEEQKRVVALARARFANAKNFKLPKTDHGVWEKALSLRADGVFDF